MTQNYHLPFWTGHNTDNRKPSAHISAHRFSSEALEHSNPHSAEAHARPVWRCTLPPEVNVKLRRTLIKLKVSALYQGFLCTGTSPHTHKKSCCHGNWAWHMEDPWAFESHVAMVTFPENKLKLSHMGCKNCEKRGYLKKKINKTLKQSMNRRTSQVFKVFPQ